jgi:hypothetical protein
MLRLHFKYTAAFSPSEVALGQPRDAGEPNRRQQPGETIPQMQQAPKRTLCLVRKGGESYCGYPHDCGGAAEKKT